MLITTLIFSKGMHDQKIIIPLLVILVLTIAIPLQDAFAIEIKDFKMKFVFSFTKLGTTETQIRNYITNQVYPDIRDTLINKLNSNFQNHEITKQLTIFSQGNDRYQVYPKVWFSGNTTLSKTQLKNGLDSKIDDWLSIVEGHLALQNATDVTYHMHKSFGRVTVDSANL